MSIASTTPEAEATGPTFAGDFSLAAVKRLIASCSGLEWSGSTLSSLMHPSEHQQSAEKTDIGGIMRACQSGDVEVIRLMHAMGVDVSKRTEPLWAEWTPIQQAAVSGNANCVECLARILRGVPGALNIQSDTVPAPVHCAAMFGHVGVLQALADAGADLRLTRSRQEPTAPAEGSAAPPAEGSPLLFNELSISAGWSAADYAAYYGKYEAVEFLCENGALDAPTLNEAFGKALICPPCCIILDPWLEDHRSRIPGMTIESSERKAQLVKRIAERLFFDAQGQPHTDVGPYLGPSTRSTRTMVAECSGSVYRSLPPEEAYPEDLDDFRTWRNLTSYKISDGDTAMPFFYTETLDLTSTWTEGNPWDMHQKSMKAYKTSDGWIASDFLNFLEFTACEYVCSSWLPRVAIGGDSILMNALLGLVQHRRRAHAFISNYRLALEKAVQSNHVEITALLLDWTEPWIHNTSIFSVPLLHQAVWMNCSMEMIQLLKLRRPYEQTMAIDATTGHAFGYGCSALVQGSKQKGFDGVYVANGLAARYWKATKRAFYSPQWIKNDGDTKRTLKRDTLWHLQEGENRRELGPIKDEADYHSPFAIRNWRLKNGNEKGEGNLRVRAVIPPMPWQEYISSMENEYHTLIRIHSPLPMGADFNILNIYNLFGCPITPVKIAEFVGNGEAAKCLAESGDIIPQTRPGWKMKIKGRVVAKMNRTSQVEIQKLDRNTIGGKAEDNWSFKWYQRSDIEPVVTVPCLSLMRSRFRSHVGRGTIIDSTLHDPLYMIKDPLYWRSTNMVNDQGHSACRTRIFKKGVLTGEDATFIGHYMRMLELPAFSQVQSNRKLPDPPLHTAVRYGHGHVLDAIIACEPPLDLNSTNFHGLTALAVASARGNVAMVGKLLASGRVDVQKSGRRGRTAALMAASQGHVDVLDMLWEAGADMGLADTRGRSPSFVAAENGHLNVLEAMFRFTSLARDDDRAEEEDNENEEIHIAQLYEEEDQVDGWIYSTLPSARTPKIQVAFNMFQMRSGPHRRTAVPFQHAVPYGLHLIDVAVAKGHAAVVRWLLELPLKHKAKVTVHSVFGANFPDKFLNLLRLAAHFNRPEVLKVLGCHWLDRILQYLQIPFDVAIKNSAYGSVKFFISLQKNSLAKNYESYLPLAQAVSSYVSFLEYRSVVPKKERSKVENIIRIIGALLDAGADPEGADEEGADEEGKTPLTNVCSVYNSEYTRRVVTMFLHHNAAVNPPCSRTPLGEIVENAATRPSSDSMELCRELVSRVADVNNISDTPILFRCLDKNTVRCYGDLEYLCVWGERYINLDCIQLLLEKGADLSRPNKEGHLFLYKAIEHASLGRIKLRDMKAILRMILDRGASIDSPNPHGEDFDGTPLLAAAKCFSVELVKLLCAHGADPNRTCAGKSLWRYVAIEPGKQGNPSGACKTLAALRDVGFDLGRIEDENTAILKSIISFASSREYRKFEGLNLIFMFKFLVTQGPCGSTITDPGPSHWKRCLFRWQEVLQCFAFDENTVNRFFLPLINLWATSLMVDQFACASALLRTPSNIPKRLLSRKFFIPKDENKYSGAARPGWKWWKCVQPSNTSFSRPESPSSELRGLVHIPELRRLLVSFLVCKEATSRKLIRELAMQHGMNRSWARKLLSVKINMGEL